MVCLVECFFGAINMKRSRLLSLGMGLLLTFGGVDALMAAPPDDPPAPGLPAALPEAEIAQVDANAGPVRQLAEGPLHEAFLSPARDNDPDHIDKAPPQPITERPGVDRPSADAQWIEGYWQWEPTKKDFVWTTGTWRVPPPGKFWVNGFWKRDDKGWYRVGGFWSDRRTDRVNF